MHLKSKVMSRLTVLVTAVTAVVMVGGLMATPANAATITTAATLTATRVAAPQNLPGGGGGSSPTIHHYCNFGSAWENWDSQKANSCQGVYEIVEGTTNPVVIFKVNHASSAQWVALGKAINNGYNAAQKWCGSNSLTCGIITAVGVTYAFSVIAA